MGRRRRGKNGKRKTVGYGYVGKWLDGTLGWSAPEFVHGSCIERPSVYGSQSWKQGRRHYLCKITVEQVFDKRGRPIVWIPKKKGAPES